MTEGKFWARAMTQGGGMGYVGDLVLKGPTEQRGNSAEQGGRLHPPGRLLGAVAGLVGDLGIINAWKLPRAGHARRRRAGALGQLLSCLRRSVAGARGVGALGRAQPAEWIPLAHAAARAQDWGQGYWWEPARPRPTTPPISPMRLENDHATRPTAATERPVRRLADSFLVEADPGEWRATAARRPN